MVIMPGSVDARMGQQLVNNKPLMCMHAYIGKCGDLSGQPQRGRATRKPRRALKRIYRDDSDDTLDNAMTKKRDWQQNDDAEVNVLLSSIWD